MKENSANTIWKLIKHLPETPLIWNAFPLHPHHPNKPFTNRRPRQEEIDATFHRLTAILEIFQPQAIVAVGRVAESLLQKQNIPRTYVRHPSHGGIPQFRQGILQLYLPSLSPGLMQL